MKKKTLRLYDSCKDLPIYNFCMMMPNRDLKYLIKDYTKYSPDQLTALIEFNKVKLNLNFNLIFEEHNQIRFDRRELLKIKEEGSLLYLKSTYDVARKILKVYLDHKDEGVLILLNDLDFISYNEAKETTEEVLKVTRMIKGLKNRINIAKAKYEKKYGSKSEDVDFVKDDIYKNLDKQALTLETNLELGYRININKTSVVRWLNLIDRNEQKIKTNG